MMRKSLKNYYSDIDEEKIRSRIFSEIGLPEKSVTDTPARKRRHSYFAVLSAAAAVFIAVVIARAGFASPELSDNSVYTDTDSGYSETVDSEADTEDTLFFPAENGWNYTNVSLSSAKSYNYSDFDDTPAPYFENNSSDDFFVESEVLDSTDFFLDCTVEEIDYDSYSQTVNYTVSPIHVICPENISLSERIVLRSGTAYVMSAGKEYLLPVCRGSDGNFNIADSSAPHIMITPEGYVIYQNGWTSLSENSLYVTKDKASPDDFFYDRMNITPESALQDLFDSFFKLKEVFSYEK